jgi:multiple sugar transport system ATP-binding protein
MNFLKGIIQKDGDYFFAPEGGNCKINLGKHLPPTLENYIGKPLQLGVRPEHILICEENEDGKPDCSLPVTAYENMGNEQLVYFEFGDRSLIVRRSPKDTLEFGREKGLRFESGKLIFIDESTQNIIPVR